MAISKGQARIDKPGNWHRLWRFLARRELERRASSNGLHPVARQVVSAPHGEFVDRHFGVFLVRSFAPSLPLARSDAAHRAVDPRRPGGLALGSPLFEVSGQIF